jgi:hypothetical protein
VFKKIQWHKKNYESANGGGIGGKTGLYLTGAYGRDYGSKGKLQDNDVCDTLQAAMGEGGGNVPIIKTIGNYSPSGYEASRIVDSDGIAPSLTEPNHNNQRLFDGLRIRKLTPKECWRLMRVQ